MRHGSTQAAEAASYNHGKPPKLREASTAGGESILPPLPPCTIIAADAKPVVREGGAKADFV
jgi:hypothetical protein